MGAPPDGDKKNTRRPFRSNPQGTNLRLGGKPPETKKTDPSPRCVQQIRGHKKRKLGIEHQLGFHSFLTNLKLLT